MVLDSFLFRSRLFLFRSRPFPRITLFDVGESASLRQLPTIQNMERRVTLLIGLT